MVSVEIERFARSPGFRMENIIINEPIIRETKKRVAISLLELNGIIFLISGTLGHFVEAIHQTINYYNRQRIHTSLKMSPAQFRLLHL